jgi:hypothetical protein
VLGGTLVHATNAELIFRWPPSPMRVVAEIASDAEEGPVAIELDPDRDVGLCRGPIPLLGTVFTIDRRLTKL